MIPYKLEKRTKAQLVDTVKRMTKLLDEKSASPRKMKRYSEDCNPEKPGWYWVAYRTFDPEPMYFDGVAWFESDCGYEMLSDPHFWLEMEPPEKPEGEA